MSIGKKIIGGYAVILALMLIAVITGFYLLKTIQSSYNEFLDVDEELIKDSKELRFEVRDQIAHYRALLLYPEEEKVYLDDLQEDFRQSDAILKRMQSNLRKEEIHEGQIEERLSLLDEISNLQVKHKQALEKATSLEFKGNHTEAIALGIAEILPLSTQLVDKAELFAKLETELEAQSRADNNENASRLSLAMTSVSIFALILGLIIGIYLTRSITRQLRDREAQRDHAEERLQAASFYARGLIEASLDALVTISKDGKITDVNKATEQVTGVTRERLIGSDFSDYFTEPEKARVGYQQVFSKGFVRDYPLAIRHASGKVIDVLYNAVVYKNEAGEVQGVFAAARDVTERKKMEEKLSHAQEIMEAVNALATSAGEIFAVTKQLAASSSETATTVSQTTATSEELRQTSVLSGEKAKNVLESAKKTTSVAQQGSTAVAQNMEAIKRIKGHAEFVAESIVKLSEQTQAIEEITTTVNDIAEQSNLLAVNAAIEAAKAGEQGKGFSVVAGEIKSLAGQSKQATAQVRVILTDIQKATNATVMATEQVSKAVEGGVKQATEAGEAIRQLADNIREAEQAATQVAASSQQQLVGIDQIASAMENIKQATQQNVAGIKQAEKAAHDLDELGQKLKAMVKESKA